MYERDLTAYKNSLSEGDTFFHQDKDIIYEESDILDKKENTQLEPDVFFEEIKSICIENFDKFNPREHPEEPNIDKYGGFGVFFHKLMLQKYKKRLKLSHPSDFGRFHIVFLNNLSPFDFIKLLGT